MYILSALSFSHTYTFTLHFALNQQQFYFQMPHFFSHIHTHKFKYMRDFLCLYATLHPFHLFTQCLHFIFRSYPSGSIFFCSLSFFHSFAYITMNVIQRLSVCVWFQLRTAYRFKIFFFGNSFFFSLKDMIYVIFKAWSIPI